MNTRKLLKLSNFLFDNLEKYWESRFNLRWLGTIIVVSFLVSLAMVELNNYNFLPNGISKYFSDNHFIAVEIAFILLLFFEVIGLVLVLPKSFAGSLIKQFEIISLILLRNAFKEFKYFEEPIIWDNISENVYHMVSDAFGAVLIFGGILIIKSLQKHRDITKSDIEKTNFISFKKLISLGLLVIFTYLAVLDIKLFLNHEFTFKFFATFYTVLVFTDILVVLVALRYSFSYVVLFRNSGFAIATILLRIALTAPVYYNAALGILTILFVMLLTYIYSRYSINCENE